LSAVNECSVRVEEEEIRRASRRVSLGYTLCLVEAVWEVEIQPLRHRLQLVRHIIGLDDWVVGANGDDAGTFFAVVATQAG
jgi:hypothetical protein